MRIAVIGMGSIGQRHCGNLRALGCDVDGFDPDPSKGVPHPDELRHGPTTHQAWVIASPYVSHLAYVEDAVARGMPFYLEKPIGAVDDLVRWRELSHAELPIHQVGYQCRFHREAQFFKQMAPSRVDAQCFVDVRTWPGVYGDWLLECSHEIDLVLWWGADSTVQSVNGYTDTEVMITLDGGTVWIRSQYKPMRREWSGIGDEGAGHKVFFWDENPLGDQVYIDAMRHFVARVQGGVPLCVGPGDGPQLYDPAATLADGVKVLEVCAQVEALKPVEV